MKLKRIQDWKELKGAVVLVRAELNVPLTEGGEIEDDERILASLPTIMHLQKSGARTVIISHLGRPEGKDQFFSLKPIAKAMGDSLGSKVRFVDEVIGKKAEAAVDDLSDGDVLMLENIRFYKEEQENDTSFAKQLASLGDYYVNDAFGVCHRAHASVSAIAREMPAAAGLLVQEEVEELSYIRNSPAKPFVVIIGGAKIKTKVGVLRKMLRVADKVIVGGAIANTLLAAKGYEMGASLLEEEMFSVAESLLSEKGLVLPTDVALQTGGTVAVDKLKKTDVAIDLGPETLSVMRDSLQKAKTVMWNGPLGKFEDKRGSHGTKEAARILGSLQAKTIAGGGETVQAIKQENVQQQINFVSTGGGAMLAFVEGVSLPGLEPLIQ